MCMLLFPGLLLLISLPSLKNIFFLACYILVWEIDFEQLAYQI